MTRSAGSAMRSGKLHPSDDGVYIGAIVVSLASLVIWLWTYFRDGD
jgi:hypothetical protein